MYNYFIQTKKKVHKHPISMQWMDADTFSAFLVDVKTKDGSKYIKSWRSKCKKNNRNSKK